MTTRRVVLLVCDTCGEVFDHGARIVRQALAGARHEGWERKRVDGELHDTCGVCLGKYVRTGMGFLEPVRARAES